MRGVIPPQLKLQPETSGLEFASKNPVSPWTIMNISRIDIPVAPVAPHFDDESTVVSARRVVPLGRAKMRDGGRKTLTLLPFLLAATLCGALGAFAVNYLERRQGVSSAVPPQSTVSAQVGQALPSQNPIESASVEKALPLEEPKDSLPADSSQESNSDAPTETPGKMAGRHTTTTKADENAVDQKKVTNSESRQLVRPRRVHPPKDQEPTTQSRQPKSGAGRIQDIFGGSNP